MYWWIMLHAAYMSEPCTRHRPIALLSLSRTVTHGVAGKTNYNGMGYRWDIDGISSAFVSEIVLK